MKTKHIQIISDKLDSGLETAAELLKKGQVVVFPTETVYGLGAAISNEEGLKKIFETKGRPADNPLIVHIADTKDLKDLVVEIPAGAEELIDRYWPGPLTLIFKKKDHVSDLVTAGLDTVAIRMPDNKIARDLIKTLGEPIAAPSANISGRPSITRDNDLIEEFDGKVAALILSDPSRIGIESTVLDLTGEEPTLLRPGYISRDEISELLERKVKRGYGGHVKNPKSPGMKYKHYSPNARVLLVTGTPEEQKKKVLDYQNKRPEEEIALVQVNPDENIEGIKVVNFNTLDEYRHNVYSVFRDLDKAGIQTILAQKPLETERDAALIDRLEHASNYEEI